MALEAYLTGIINRWTGQFAPALHTAAAFATFERPGKAAGTTSSRPASVVAMAGEQQDEQPKNFPYTHLWVSKDGETHIYEGKMKGFDLKSYAAEPQFVKEIGHSVKKTVFSELAPGLKNDYHPCPNTQFVVCIKGSWMVKTTDGTERVFKAGDVLFQDDTENCPSDKPPQHYSAVVGDEPNQQFIIQIDRKEEVDNPGPL
eukprot:jgi/Astpho2/3466/Aster-x0165